MHRQHRPQAKIMASKFKSTLATGIGIGLASIAITGLAAPQAQAADEFGNNAVQFDKETAIEFEFLESHGSYKATFGVMDLNTGAKTALIKEDKQSDSDERAVNKASDFLGTPGNAVSQPKNIFKFQANTPYTFYLESRDSAGRVASTVYSTSLRNPSSSTQTQFDKDFAGLAAQGVKLSWDDRAKEGFKPAEDYNDFIVIAGGSNCPCDKTPTDTSAVAPDPDVAPAAPKPRKRIRGRG
jgi:hypothetical protein